MKEHFLCCEVVRIFIFFIYFFYCGTSLCDRHFNYGKLFFFPFFQLKRLGFFWDSSQHPLRVALH